MDFSYAYFVFGPGYFNRAVILVNEKWQGDCGGCWFRRRLTRGRCGFCPRRWDLWVRARRLLNDALTISISGAFVLGLMPICTTKFELFSGTLFPATVFRSVRSVRDFDRWPSHQRPQIFGYSAMPRKYYSGLAPIALCNKFACRLLANYGLQKERSVRAVSKRFRAVGGAEENSCESSSLQRNLAGHCGIYNFRMRTASGPISGRSSCVVEFLRPRAFV